MNGPCPNEFGVVIQCVEGNPGPCVPCLDPSSTSGGSNNNNVFAGSTVSSSSSSSDWETSLAEGIEEAFRTTLGFVPNTQQGFCEEANRRVCDHFQQNLVRTPFVYNVRNVKRRGS